jgi:hypothetical protein
MESFREQLETPMRVAAVTLVIVVSVLASRSNLVGKPGVACQPNGSVCFALSNLAKPVPQPKPRKVNAPLKQVVATSCSNAYLTSSAASYSQAQLKALASTSQAEDTLRVAAINNSEPYTTFVAQLANLYTGYNAQISGEYTSYVSSLHGCQPSIKSPILFQVPLAY